MESAYTSEAKALDMSTILPEGSQFRIGTGSGAFVRGLSGKWLIDGRNMFRANLGMWDGGPVVSRQAPQRYAMSCDFVFLRPDLLRSSEIRIAYHISAGAGMGMLNSNQNVGVALGLIAGLDLLFPKFPCEFGIEYRPGLNIYPNIEVDMFDLTGKIRFPF